MSRKDYGIESIADAFLALRDMDEDIKIPNNAKRKGLKEAASVDVRSPEDIDLAQNFRKTDKKEEDSELEVIDVDADSIENLQDGKSYIGKMLLQCNSCKATRFIDVDKLVADENDKELYNVEDECPHCHNSGTGYALIGQVGKADEENPEDEASLDNDANSGEEAMFDNTNEVEPESEETPAEENTESNEESSSEEETNYDETNSEDDTNDMELPELGDEFDVDDVTDDDTEDEDDEKTKKESLEEDYSVDDIYQLCNVIPLDECDDDEVNYEAIEDLEAEVGCKVLGIIDSDIDELNYYYWCDDGNAYMGVPEGPDYNHYRWYSKSIDEIAELINGSDNEYEEEDDSNPETYGDELINDFETRHPWNDDIDEELDMATFEGSIANLVDTFTIEDNPVNIKLLNKNGSELGMYGSDDLPFNVKSQMMDTFNTDDNYLEINVTEEGSDESTTVNDLFNYYRPDEDNQTTFVVTNVDTDEEQDFEDLTEFLETYGDYYIDGALGLRTLNIYIADGDLETEVEPLDDEEIEELGKENAEKEETEVTEESLIEEIIKSYPGLKLNRISNSLSEEYFIADSIRLNEDLDLVYKNFIKPTNNNKLIEHFKSYTGYEDEVDKFLKEHNISKEKYNKIINESPDELGLATEDEIEGTYQAAVDDADKQRRHAIDDRENTLNKYVVFLDLDRNGNEHKGYVNSEFDSEEFYWGDVITPLSNINDLYLFDSYDEALEAMNQIIDQAEDMSSKAIENGDDTKELKVLERKIKQVKELYNSTATNEKLLCSVKDRKELGETINKLVEVNEKYRISKSLTEGYRYDIFVNEDCKVNEGFDNKLIQKVLADAKDEYNRYKDETDEPMAYFIGQSADSFDVPFDKWYVFFPDHISEDDEEFKAFKRGYEDNGGTVNEGLFDENENEVVGDDVDADDSKSTELTFEDKIDRIASDICNAISDAYDLDISDMKDEIVNDIRKDLNLTDSNEDSEGVSKELDSEEYTTESIFNKIKSNVFLEAMKNGKIPFINESHIKKLINEDIELNNDNTSEDDCEKRLSELTYLQTQRELTDEEKEELAYCQNRVNSNLTDLDFNKDEFDDCVNDYLTSDDEFYDSMAYRTLDVDNLDEGLIVKGIIEGVNEDKNIVFTIKPEVNESKQSQKKYIVTNNLNNKKFKLEL